MAAAVAIAPSPATAAPGDYTQYLSFMQTGGPTWIPWADSEWIPQGLTKLSESSLVISYYDNTKTYNSRLAVINRSDGKRTAWYELNTKGHVGGLAISDTGGKKFFWVSQPDGADDTKDKLWRYAPPSPTAGTGQTLTAQAGYTVPASSYAFGQGDSVWVGEFGKGWKAGLPCPTYANQTQAQLDAQKMYQYRISSTGVPSLISGRTFATPLKVQGVAITGDRFIWSTSCGRDNNSQLIFGPPLRNYDGSSVYTTVAAPNMSEGMVFANNQLQIVFESASSVFYDADVRTFTVNRQYGTLP